MGETLISAARGMRDILPPQAAVWRRLENAVAACFARYGYAEIRTPLVERLELFRRQLGEHTDIVQKEMYVFADALNNDKLALRPEATVSTVRALLAGGGARAGVLRVWYGGAMFRHERPQQGRYRQFHQFGAEATGAKDPRLDAEQIIMLWRLWRELGVADQLQLEINNLGSPQERAQYAKNLQAHFAPHAKNWDDAARQRLQNNPLRLLDSKEEGVMQAAAGAPPPPLGDDSRRFVDAVKERLAAAGAPFCERPQLARGLDYYNLTVYEFSPKNDERRQNTLCGGGRYDGLAQSIGGAPMPGCGFAMGAERLLALLQPPPPPPPQCCLIAADDTAENYAQQVAEACRDGGLVVWRHLGGGGLAKGLKRANAMQTPLALIVGDAEARGEYVTIKRLADGSQRQAPRARLAQTAKDMLSTNPKQ